jgi:hypothetical protein
MGGPRIKHAAPLMASIEQDDKYARLAEDYAAALAELTLAAQSLERIHRYRTLAGFGLVAGGLGLLVAITKSGMPGGSLLFMAGVTSAIYLWSSRNAMSDATANINNLQAIVRRAEKRLRTGREGLFDL